MNEQQLFRRLPSPGFEKCAQVGPRGGQCRRNAQVIRTNANAANKRVSNFANWFTLDFCQPHNQKAKNLVLLVTKYNLSTGEALELQKTAGSLHRLYEAACNYELTPRQETRQHNLYRKATEIISAERTAGQELYGPSGTWTIGCGHKGTQDVFRLGPVQTPGCLHPAAGSSHTSPDGVRGCVCLCHGGSPVAFIREQRDPRGWPLEVSLEPMTDSQTYDYVCPF